MGLLSIDLVFQNEKQKVILPGEKDKQHILQTVKLRRKKRGIIFNKENCEN